MSQIFIAGNGKKFTWTALVVAVPTEPYDNCELCAGTGRGSNIFDDENICTGCYGKGWKYWSPPNCKPSTTKHVQTKLDEYIKSLDNKELP